MKINKLMCGEDIGDVTGELNQSSMVVGGGGGSARLDLSTHGILSYPPPWRCPSVRCWTCWPCSTTATGKRKCRGRDREDLGDGVGQVLMTGWTRWMRRKEKRRRWGRP